MLLVGDLNIFFFWFFLILINFLLNNNNILSLLLFAELLWIVLYLIVTLMGLIYDNINLLALSFFFLIFSAVELSSGLLLLLMHQILMRSSFINQNDLNFNKFILKYFQKSYLNSYYFKK